MRDTTPPAERSLRDIAEHDRRLAAEAARDADTERPVAAGVPDHPHPQIAAADHLRAADDVETYERQRGLAADQARAAEQLEQNAARLRDTAAGVRELRADAAERTDDVRALEHDARDLRDQTQQAADTVRRTDVPDVGGDA